MALFDYLRINLLFNNDIWMHIAILLGKNTRIIGVENMIFSFVSFGQPVAKGRPRVTRFATYTPKKTKEAEQRIEFDFMTAVTKKRALISFPLVDPLKVICRCYFAMPKKPKNKDWHITKPDADNLGKSLDALNGLAWADDSQIVDLQVTKQYIDAIITQPQIQIEIYALGRLE